MSKRIRAAALLSGAGLALLGCDEARVKPELSTLQGQDSALACQIDATARPEGTILHIRYANQGDQPLSILKTGSPLDARAHAFRVRAEGDERDAAFIAPRIEPSRETWVTIRPGEWIQNDYPLSNNYELTASRYSAEPRLGLTVRDSENKLAFLKPVCGVAAFEGPTLGQASEPLLTYQPDCGNTDQSALAAAQNMASYMTSANVIGAYVTQRNADGSPHWLVSALFDHDSKFDNTTSSLLSSRFADINQRYTSTSFPVDSLCADVDSGDCIGANAYVYPGGTEAIHFCTAYFGTNAVYRASVLAHEISHEIFNTNDDRYDGSMHTSATDAWADELADPVLREAGYSTLQAYVRAGTWLKAGSADNPPETTAEHYEGMVYLATGEHVNDLHLQVLGENVTGPRLEVEVGRMGAGRDLRSEFGEVTSVVQASANDVASWQESETLRSYLQQHGAGATSELATRLSLAADQYDYMRAGKSPVRDFATFAELDDGEGSGTGVSYARSDVAKRGAPYFRSVAAAKLIVSL